MRECAHIINAEQPRNLGYMQLAVIKVSNCQMAQPRLGKGLAALDQRQTFDTIS